MSTQDLDETLDLTPSPRILSVIAEVDLQLHQCLAELIDNCFDELRVAAKEDANLEPRVDVTLPASDKVARQSIIHVGDNGRGMSTVALQSALRAGSSAKARFGTLGLFGMGFNIATARMGSLTEVRTGRKGDTQWTIVTIDLIQMQRKSTYHAPVRHEPKRPEEHGTLISVTNLNDDMISKLATAATIRQTKTMLGRIYTYMLRDPGADYSGADMMGGERLGLYVNRRAVTPFVPCIWDPSRSVQRKGATVHTARKLDLPLADAFACMDCGFWHASQVDECVDCLGGNILRRERRIWGWVGIQRYADKSDFGLSFFRQSRCIIYQDKSLFDWRSDDGEIELEYPIELGMGRIVGEIHIDHAPVNVRKSDFDKSSREWIFMVEKMRGLEPLRPNIAKSRGYRPNTSVLSEFFNAFREVKPGLKSLIPGNGKQAIHDKSKEWAAEFRKGDAEYATDEKWYLAAKAHDDLKAGKPEVRDPLIGGVDDDQEGNDWLDLEGLGHLTDEGAAAAAQDADVEPPVAPSPPETDDERFARYRAGATLLPGSDGEVRIDSVRTTLRIYLTSGIDLQRNGKVRQPYAIRASAGQVEVFVAEESPLIEQFGWSPMDAAIVQAAGDIGSLYGYPGEPQDLIVELLQQFPDRKIDSDAVRSRAEALLAVMRDRLTGVVAADPDTFWMAMRPTARRAAENVAARMAPDIQWPTSVANGDFAQFLSVDGISDLVNEVPEHLFDGALFRSTYRDWTPETQADTAARLASLLADLRRMVEGPLPRRSLELARHMLTADLLDAEVVDE